MVVEGDIGLSSRRVSPYAARRIEIAKALHADPDAERQGLLGMERDGKILRWRRGKTLRYCVWRPTFGSDAEHAAVVEAMAVATSDWTATFPLPVRHGDPAGAAQAVIGQSWASTREKLSLTPESFHDGVSHVQTYAPTYET